MTNEAKSIEIASKVAEGYGVNFEPLAEAALDMAEWKDAQFEENLEKKREILMDAYRSIEQDKDKGGTIWCNPICFLDQLINELFKED